MEVMACPLKKQRNKGNATTHPQFHPIYRNVQVSFLST